MKKRTILACLLSKFIFLSLWASIPVSAQQKRTIEVQPALGHTVGFPVADISKDRKYVLSGGLEGTLMLWDLDTELLVRSVTPHKGRIILVRFLPDGQSLLSVDQHGAKVTDKTTGRELNAFPKDLRPAAIAASSNDGSFVALLRENKIELWDTASGTLRHTISEAGSNIVDIAVASDGSRIIGVSKDGSLFLWGANKGNLIRRISSSCVGVTTDTPKIAISATGDEIACVIAGGSLARWASASGALLGSASSQFNDLRTRPVYFDNLLLQLKDQPVGDGYRYQLLDAVAGKQMASWENRWGSAISVIKDNLMVESNYLGAIIVRNGKTGSILHTLESRVSHPSGLLASSDGGHLLSGSLDGSLRWWDTKTGKLEKVMRLSTGDVDLHDIWLAPNGRLALIQSGNVGELWDIQTGALKHKLPFEGGLLGRVVRFSPDSKKVLFATTDDEAPAIHLALYAVADGRRLSASTVNGRGISSASFSELGSRVLVSDRSELKLYDAASGALINSWNKASQSEDGISPDGRTVISAYANGHVELRSGDNQSIHKAVKTGAGKVLDIHFSPDSGRVLIIRKNDTVTLIDVATAEALEDLSLKGIVGKERAYNLPTSFSTDGLRLLLQGAEDAIYWNQNDANRLVRLGKNGAIPLFSALSPDGTRAFVATSDGTISVWNTRDGTLMMALIGGTDGDWLSLTPDGFFTGASAATKLLTVVRGLASYSISQFFEQLYRPDLVEEALKGDPEGRYKDASYRLNLEKVLDSGPAPAIELLEKKTEQAGGTVRLTFRVQGTGGGIGEDFVSRVNGITQGEPKPAALRALAKDPLAAATVTETLIVDPGRSNTIEVVAYNGAGLLATPPLRVTVDPFGVTTEERPRMHVLGIGVDKYRMKDFQLRYAVSDVGGFSNAMKMVGSSLFAEVAVTQLLDEQVTRENIAAAFDKISEASKPTDVFVLFLSGHGKSVEGRYYYYPQDLDFAIGQTYQNAIGQEQWQEWLAQVPAQKTLLILDTCESGAAGGLVRGGGNVRQTAMDQLQHATGQNLIAAAGGTQAAIEGYKGHGVLTYALLDALDKKDGQIAEEKIKVGALADFVDERVPAITQSVWGDYQRPVRKLSGNDFPIGLRAAVLSDEISEFVGKGFILMRDERVRELPQDDAVGERILEAPTVVDVVRFEGGWALIAVTGQKLGYVPAEAVKRPH